MPKKQLKTQKVTVADIYPQLSLEEQIEAEENLRQYLKAVKGIFTRLSDEMQDTFDGNPRSALVLPRGRIRPR